MAQVRIKRVYEVPSESDGYRVLVDRIWARGLRKADVHFDEWLKELAPSAALRKWFRHDPEKWSTFKRKYTTELEQSDAALKFKETVQEKGTVTLLYAAKDKKHNNAAVLQSFLK